MRERLRGPVLGVLVLLAAATLAGCAQPERGTVLVHGTNLALGTRPGLSAAAQRWVGRSDWPAKEWGYVFEDVTYYRRDAYDGQLFFDRYNSSFFVNDSTRTGVLIR